MNSTYCYEFLTVFLSDYWKILLPAIYRVCCPLFREAYPWSHRLSDVFAIGMTRKSSNHNGLFCMKDANPRSSLSRTRHFDRIFGQYHIIPNQSYKPWMLLPAGSLVGSWAQYCTRTCVKELVSFQRRSTVGVSIHIFFCNQFIFFLFALYLSWTISSILISFCDVKVRFSDSSLNFVVSHSIPRVD